MAVSVEELTARFETSTLTQVNIRTAKKHSKNKTKYGNPYTSDSYTQQSPIHICKLSTTI